MGEKDDFQKAVDAANRASYREDQEKARLLIQHANHLLEQEAHNARTAVEQQKKKPDPPRAPGS